ncbi:hypothetical protein [Rhodovulum marinum]|uniref:Uncharacterized protein n=1 Tax=Rhodovulum marinum TaxID=320662 RepID=A0A4R2PZF1_9RHOB|nr:hypothetical protein [Rhodovulum marinum]TCP39611.1 hypothetical protein EV662_11191 [Rhodovulum marinum]
MFATTALGILGLGAALWMLFTLAIYALPFWIGMMTALHLLEAGQGVILSVGTGLFAGAATLALGEIAFARIRSVPVRLVIASAYAGPAGIAGFHAAKGLAELAGAGPTAETLLSWLGALVIGGTAWGRITTPASPDEEGALPPA